MHGGPTTASGLAVTEQLDAAQRSAAKFPAILALILGLFMILGTGFVHSSTIHDAAHDTRHAFTFPCH